MAKIKDNYVTQGITGKIGDHIFKYNKFGNSYISDPPDRSGVVSTKRQKKLRNNFAKAVSYAKSVLKDPVKAAKYHTGDNKSLYVRAMKDYLNQHKIARKKAAALVINDALILNHHLSSRQVKALRHIQKKGRISNSDYQYLNHVSKPTATRDLQDLVNKAILKGSGMRGAGAFYEIIGSDT
jgi:predicted HTH transcriptional regulator